MLHSDRRIAFICILTLSSVLLSCKAQYHIERAEKHREKALKKGATFTNDTTYVYGDTIINTYWKDSIRVIEKIVTNTEYIEGEIRYITKKDKRIARRKERKADKYRFKLRKKEIQVEKKKSRWFVWLVIGSIITLLIQFVWKHYLRFYLRR